MGYPDNVPLGDHWFVLQLSIPFMGYYANSINYLGDYRLSIPFMGYIISKFCNKITYHIFQFPLWDTLTILKFLQNEKNLFQFPLWDTRSIFCSKCNTDLAFQFPLWDTNYR